MGSYGAQFPKISTPGNWYFTTPHRSVRWKAVILRLKLTENCLKKKMIDEIVVLLWD